jgi:anti-sigma regulatory factor (Ser/Thr protein kinase)
MHVHPLPAFALDGSRMSHLVEGRSGARGAKGRGETVGLTGSGVRDLSSTVATRERPETRSRPEVVTERQIHREPVTYREWGAYREPLPPVDVPAGTISCELPSDLTAVRQARSVVRQVLGNWRADDIFDDVVLVASELVANALRHGMRAADLVARPAAQAESVRLSLVSTGSHVICAVTDPSEAPPVRRVGDLLAGSGRGLQLVESLSLCWGWTVLDGYEDGSSGGAVQGKSVWAIFPLQVSARQSVRTVGAA